MKWPCAILSLLALAAGGRASPLPRPNDLPDLTAEQGRGLIHHARDAMLRYLSARTPPDTVPAAAVLRPLRDHGNAAAVTLRHDGLLAGMVVRTEADLATNVAAAAQQAMRSPRLPDRIDRKVVDALTVEVEVLSYPRPVERESLDAIVVPGLMGMAYWRQAPATAPAAAAAPPEASSWILPSAAYILGLGAEEMRRAAMGRFQLTPANAALPSQLATFTARHYVGLPDGRCLELFRGKDLPPRADLDGEPAVGTAARIGRFLATCQSPSGRYELPGFDSSVSEHMHAAWAMAALAGRGGDVQIARSASTAMVHAKSLVRRSAGPAIVPADTADESLAATGFLLLALAKAGADGESQDLRGPLRQGLLEELRRQPATGPSTRPAAATRGTCIALPALGEAKEAEALRKAAGAAGFADPIAALWACQARLPGAWPWPKDLAISQLGQGSLPDEKGAFLLAGRPATAVDTSLVAVCLAASAAQPGAPPDQVAKLRAQLAEARRFCARSMYLPGEAYFRANPDELTGAVRISPAAAAISLTACAAAIQALLAE